MDLETQEKVSKLLLEQAEKLGKALKALRKISNLDDSIHGDSMNTAIGIADDTLREISDYGKRPEDL